MSVMMGALLEALRCKGKRWVQKVVNTVKCSYVRTDPNCPPQLPDYSAFMKGEHATKSRKAEEYKETAIRRMDTLIAKLPDKDLRDRV